MNDALRDLIGQRVKVWSGEGQTSYTDEGVLEAFVDPWIRLRNDQNELLCFPVYNVRLVKRLAR
jgi:hypothetical protein